MYDGVFVLGVSLDQLHDLADKRLIVGCIHCGGSEETRDHSPSKVFLDEPFPEQLPKLPSCEPCNNDVSKDEEYVACLIESAIAGSADPSAMRRPKIRAILGRSVGLRARIGAARTVSASGTSFAVETGRINNVLTKLARGHAVFELSRQLLSPPATIAYQVLATMENDQREKFEEIHFVGLLNEIGSRATQRMMVLQMSLRAADGTPKEMGMVVNDWLDVQEGRYRYLAIDHGASVVVRIVIAEYLACEVIWTDEDGPLSDSQ